MQAAFLIVDFGTDQEHGRRRVDQDSGACDVDFLFELFLVLGVFDDIGQAGTALGRHPDAQPDHAVARLAHQRANAIRSRVGQAYDGFVRIEHRFPLNTGFVIPAKAGIQDQHARPCLSPWTPAEVYPREGGGGGDGKGKLPFPHYIISTLEQIQGQFGVLGHHVGMPGRRPCQGHGDHADAGDRGDGVGHLLRHLTRDRTGRGGQGHQDIAIALGVDFAGIDQAQIVDVHRDFRVMNGPQCGLDRVRRGGADTIGQRFACQRLHAFLGRRPVAEHAHIGMHDVRSALRPIGLVGQVIPVVASVIHLGLVLTRKSHSPCPAPRPDGRFRRGCYRGPWRRGPCRQHPSGASAARRSDVRRARPRPADR